MELILNHEGLFKTISSSVDWLQPLVNLWLERSKINPVECEPSVSSQYFLVLTDFSDWLGLGHYHAKHQLFTQH